MSILVILVVHYVLFLLIVLNSEGKEIFMFCSCLLSFFISANLVWFIQYTTCAGFARDCIEIGHGLYFLIQRSLISQFSSLFRWLDNDDNQPFLHD